MPPLLRFEYCACDYSICLCCRTRRFPGAMPRPTVVSSISLTSVTAPSLADDGRSLTRRMPRKGDPTAITNWIEGTIASPILPPAVLPAAEASESEAYTGSFFDDGADLRRSSAFPAVPGFGTVDHKFYSSGKSKKHKYEEEWTAEKEKALAGDMFRSLAKLKSVARVEVRDAHDGEKRKARKVRDRSKVGAVEDDGRVRIMKPLRWGTFVIEGEDGRVVIVDEQGEYDSGKVDEREELAKMNAEYEERVKRRKEREQEKAKREAEKKAKEEVRKLRKREEEREREEVLAKAKDDRRRHKHRRRRGHSSPSRPLTLVGEGGPFEEGASVIISPTKFFMTGARSGWTPSAVSATKPPEPYSTHTQLVSAPASVKQLSPTKSALSTRSLIAATAHSTVTSITKSDDTQNERHSGTLDASAFKLPSSASSVPYSDATASTRLSVASRDPWGQTSIVGSEEETTKSKRKGPSRMRSRTNSFKSQQNDGENYLPRRPSTRISYLSQSSAKPLTAWGGDADTHSRRESSRRQRSRGRSRSSSRHVRTLEPDTTSRSSSRRAPSRKRSASGLYRKRSQESTFEYRTRCNTPRPSTHASNTSIQAWIEDSLHTDPPEHAPSQRRRTRQTSRSRAPSTFPLRSEVSQTAGATPYSWRRQVEELSDHSTIGSKGTVSRVASPAPSLLPSESRGSDGESIPGGYGDAVSIRSHSTYRAPTVQDASDEEKGTQEWNSEWGVKDAEHKQGGGQKTSEVGSAKWSGKTDWGGDVDPEQSVAGSVKQDDVDEGADVTKWQDKSGFEEDHETWLNAEVGGVKYPEAEWRVDPPEGSWRDV